MEVPAVSAPQSPSTVDVDTSAQPVGTLAARENNQGLLKALEVSRDTVKLLLIHPRNVNNVMEQLRFRYGRPEQLIRCQLVSIREVQLIQEHNIAKIVPYATRVINLAALPQLTNGEQHIGNPTLMEDLVAKLPPSKRVEWARHAATISPFPTVIHFSAWLTDYANVVCTIVGVDSKEQRRRVPHVSIDQNNKGLTNHCPICNGQHAVRDCNEFNLASPLKRWTVVKRNRLCFSCLRVGHMGRVCNTLHHDAMSHNAPQPTGDRVINTGRMPQPEDPERLERLLLRIMPVILHGANKRIVTYAPLDEGSSVTMIE
ncbi:uncharacterized protein [Drosophila virilis]|uniref:uncharacterized protein n=1 Tax=Drosophila virilis TaxID=7244 RepID=UPI0038B34AE1